MVKFNNNSISVIPRLDRGIPARFRKILDSCVRRNDRQRVQHLLSAGAFIAIIVFFALPFRVEAAIPQFMTSWRAESYVPAWYGGKVFPIKDTPVEISFELVENGRIVDLRRTAVRWYINDTLMRNEESGLGIKSLRFVNQNYPGQGVDVHISLPNYKGQPLDAILRIPVLSPEVVVENARPTRDMARGDMKFRAIPFFFNVGLRDDLGVSWRAANQPAEYGDDPWRLSVGLDAEVPSGFPIDIQVAVNNFLNELEFANNALTVQVR
ncbi:hypothetical protein HY504_02225 [Candidatus Wolfebacteria bacterium]|nr:hypothetical protein [Candidatus Wolfebacteria bacterium]